MASWRHGMAHILDRDNRYPIRKTEYDAKPTTPQTNTSSEDSVQVIRFQFFTNLVTSVIEPVQRARRASSNGTSSPSPEAEPDQGRCQFR